MSPVKAPCPFCKKEAYCNSLRGSHDLWLVDCPEVCGTFYADHSARYYLSNEATPSSLVRLTRENILSQKRGQIPYWTKTPGGELPNGLNDSPVKKSIDGVLTYPIVHSEKLDEILILLADKLSGQSPFEKVKLTDKDVYSLGIQDRRELLKWLEILFFEGSVESNELQILLESHESDDLEADIEHPYVLTPRGWHKVGQLKTPGASNRAFIAMKFGLDDRQDIQNAIENGCRAAGFEALAVDGEEYNGSISDRIIAQINSSKFMIADFTGDNQGVYYEAGYGEGRGIPVIYTVRSDDKDKLHFDTNHLNHIIWTTYEELKDRIEQRVKVIFKKGSS